MFRALPLILFCGCNVVQWETIGINSVWTHNEHVEEAEKFGRDVVENQARLAREVYHAQHEQELDAMTNNDEQKLSRVAQSKARTQLIVEKSEELTKREWHRAPASADGFGELLSTILQVLGGASLPGGAGLLFMLNSQRKKIKEKTQ